MRFRTVLLRLLPWLLWTPAASADPSRVPLVAVSHEAGLFHSTDGGLHWHPVPPPDGLKVWPKLSGLAHDGRQFLAIPASADALHASINGTKWTTARPFPVPPHAIAFQPATPQRPALCLLVTTAGIQTGSSFLKLNPPLHCAFPDSIPPTLALFGEGEAGPRFLLVAPGPGPAWRAATENGQSLLSTEPLRGPVAGAAYGGGRFVLAGTDGWIESSQDAQIWIPAPPLAAPLQRLLWSGRKFVACSNSRVWTSPDGLEWSPLAHPAPAPLLFSRENELGTLWIAGHDSDTWVSDDATHWQPSPAPLPASINRVWEVVR